MIGVEGCFLYKLNEIFKGVLATPRFSFLCAFPPLVTVVGGQMGSELLNHGFLRHDKKITKVLKLCAGYGDQFFSLFLKLHRF